MVFTAIKYIINEHIINKKRILLLSVSHAKKQTEGTTLGIGWTFIRDLAYFATLVIFRYLLAGNAQVDGMHLMVYLITGLVPWYFINEVMHAGVNAIITNKVLVMGMQFPVVVLPTIEACAIFIKRLFNILILFIIVAIFGDLTKFNFGLFLYYYTAMFLLMFAYNLFVSAVITLSKDFTNFYLTFLRAVFFLTPILWSFSKIKDHPMIISLLKLNPLAYIILGFRDVFVYGKAPALHYSLYFWAVFLILFILGCIFQFKLRKYYADYM